MPREEVYWGFSGRLFFLLVEVVGEVKVEEWGGGGSEIYLR